LCLEIFIMDSDHVKVNARIFLNIVTGSVPSALLEFGMDHAMKKE